MKNLCYPLLCLLLLAVTPRAQAQLDESQEQWDKHCGKPIKEYEGTAAGSKSCKYRRNGFELTVTFLNGKAGSIGYEKLSKGAFTASEIEALLQSNQGNSTWKAPTVTGKGKDGVSEQFWKREDGSSAIYFYIPSSEHHCMDFTAKWFDDYRTAHPAE